MKKSNKIKLLRGFLIASLLGGVCMPAYAQTVTVGQPTPDSVIIIQSAVWNSGFSNDGNHVLLGDFVGRYAWSPSGRTIDLPGIHAAGYVENNYASNNATVITGYGDNALGQQEAFYWSQATGTVGMGFLPGGNYSQAFGISDDGSVIVGASSTSSTYSEGFYWKNDGNGMRAVGFVGGGNYTSLRGVSGNGLVGFGEGTDSLLRMQAIRYTEADGVESLGFLPGSTYEYSDAKMSSYDGSVIVGRGYNSGGYQEAFRWTELTGMESLGLLSSNPNATSIANDISYDGSVIVGTAKNNAGDDEAFRWTETDGMTSLGLLTGMHMGSYSRANSVSGDGSVVVGNAESSFDQVAMIWDETNGMRTIDEMLAAEGVDTYDWAFYDAKSISRNGNIIYGEGAYQGNSSVFIVNLATAAVTTPGDLGESLNSIRKSSQQVLSSSVMQLGQELFTARNLSSLSMPMTTSSMYRPTSYGSMSFPYLAPDNPADIETSSGGSGSLSPLALRALQSKWSVYTMAGYGVGQNSDFNNHDLNGTIGISARLSDSTSIGIGVMGSNSSIDLDFGGRSKMNALGVSSLLAYEPGETGLRLYGTAFGAKVNLDTTRGYVNAGVIDSSSGETDGFSYGAAGQVGWSFKVSEKSKLIPYTELRWSQTKLDAYQETGGGFPAQFSDQDFESSSIRLGLQNNYDITETVRISTRGAWGHRLDDGENSLTATAGGLSQNLGTSGGDENWFEAGIGIGYQATERVRLNAEVSARTGDTAEPSVSTLIGASVSF